MPIAKKGSNARTGASIFHGCSFASFAKPSRPLRPAARIHARGIHPTPTKRGLPSTAGKPTIRPTMKFTQAIEAGLTAT
ncbi:hypothetical protein [Variovorax paradoxus]|uniref:hypothetical protein n=1 Tax=Variovorax paradoxus TaxID=34073 RepID=UPI003994EDEC